jgi:hypothetical protein
MMSGDKKVSVFVTDAALQEFASPPVIVHTSYQRGYANIEGRLKRLHLENTALVKS